MDDRRHHRKRYARAAPWWQVVFRAFRRLEHVFDGALAAIDFLRAIASKLIDGARGSLGALLSRSGRLFYLVAGALALILLGSDALHWRKLAEAENWVYDLVLEYRPDPRATGRVAVVEIDACSLDWWEGHADGSAWPWSRATHADLIAAIEDRRAKVIGYDILILDPAHVSDEAGDRLLVQTGGEGAPSFAFVITNETPDIGTGLDLSQISTAKALRPGAPSPRVGMTEIEFPALRGQAGFANVAPDGDGAIRDAEIWKRIRGWSVPSLPGIVVSRLRNQPYTEMDQRVRVNWRTVEDGRAEQIPTIPAADLLDSTGTPCTSDDRLAEQRMASLKGRAVFVGYAASGINDVKLLPSGEVVPGVQLLALVAEDLVAGTTISGLPAATKYWLLALMLMAISWAFWRRPPHREADEGFGLVHAVLVGISVLALFSAGIYLDIFAALAAAALFFGLLRGYANAMRHVRHRNPDFAKTPQSGIQHCVALVELPLLEDPAEAGLFCTMKRLWADSKGQRVRHRQFDIIHRAWDAIEARDLLSEARERWSGRKRPVWAPIRLWKILGRLWTRVASNVGPRPGRVLIDQLADPKAYATFSADVGRCIVLIWEGPDAEARMKTELRAMSYTLQEASVTYVTGAEHQSVRELIGMLLAAAGRKWNCLVNDEGRRTRWRACKRVPAQVEDR